MDRSTPAPLRSPRATRRALGAFTVTIACSCLARLSGLTDPRRLDEVRQIAEHGLARQRDR